jgi:hypothetical protein
MASPGRPKGLPKTGGRQKGTPNKRPTIVATLERVGFDIAEEAIKLYNDPNTPTDCKIVLLKLLAQYTYATPKSVEETPLSLPETYDAEYQSISTDTLLSLAEPSKKEE